MDETILAAGVSGRFAEMFVPKLMRQGAALTLAAILGREPRTLRTYFEDPAGGPGSGGTR